MKPSSDFIPIHELMERTGRCRASVYAAIDARQLPGEKVGGRYLVPRRAYEAYLEGLWTVPSAPAKREAAA